MKDFKKYYIINASSEEVYLALTNPFTIELWTGEKAEMSTEPNSEFSLLDGSLVGRNLEFIENKNPDNPSIVTIKLHKDEEGTSVELRHTNIPDEAYQDIVDGWNYVYFKGLRDFF